MNRRCRITVIAGPHSGITRDFAPGKYLFGRSAECHFVFGNDPSVSRQHLVLEFSDTGTICKDLGSTGGTFINQMKLQPQIATTILNQSTVRLGSSIFRIDIISINSAQTSISNAPPRVDQCIECSNTFSTFGNKSRSKEFPAYCYQCGELLKSKLVRFRNVLQSEYNQWNGTSDVLSKKIQFHANAIGIPVNLALSRASDLSAQFLQRLVSFLLQDGILDKHEEDSFHRYRDVVCLAPEHIPAIMSQIKHYAFIREIRSGNLPKVKASIRLPSGESAYIEIPVTYVRELSASTRYHKGLLILTNTRLIFTSTDHPFETSLSKILDAHLYPPGSI